MGICQNKDYKPQQGHGLVNQRQKSTLEAKIVLIGSTGVGKSSIIQRLIQGRFFTSYVRIFLFLKEVLNKQQCCHKFTFVGYCRLGEIQEVLSIISSIGSQFYKNSQAVIYCYDITSLKTYKDIQNYWINEINQSLSQEQIFSQTLLGNKLDMEENRQVSRETSKLFADQLSMNYFEVSAKNGTNIEIMFQKIANQISDKLIKKL